MKRDRLQCKDIPDELVIQAILEAEIPQWSYDHHVEGWKPTPDYWRNWDWVLPVFNRLMPEVPENLFYAKVDSLDRRGIVHACVHRPYSKGQCRGDLHIPLPGEATRYGYCC